MDQEVSSVERENGELWGFVEQCREEARYKYLKQDRVGLIDSTCLFSAKAKTGSFCSTEAADKAKVEQPTLSSLSRFPYEYPENFSSPIFSEPNFVPASPEDSTLFPFPSLNNKASTFMKRETESTHSKEDYYDICSNSAASTYVSSPKSMLESGVFSALQSYLGNAEVQKSTPSRRFSETTLNHLETNVLFDGSNKSLEGPLFTLNYHEAIELFNYVQQKTHHQTNPCFDGEFQTRTGSKTDSTTQTVSSYNNLVEENAKLAQLNEKLQSSQRTWNEEKVLLLNKYNNLALTTNKTKHDLKTISCKLKNIEDRIQTKDIQSYIDKLQQDIEKLRLENQFLSLENRLLNKKSAGDKNDGKTTTQCSRKLSSSSCKTPERTQKHPLYQQNTSSSSMKSKKNVKNCTPLESIFSKPPNKTFPKKLTISVPSSDSISGLGYSDDNNLPFKSPVFQTNSNIIYSEPVPLSPSSSLDIKPNIDILSLAKKRLIELDDMISVLAKAVSSFSQASDNPFNSEADPNSNISDFYYSEHSPSTTSLVDIERISQFCDDLVYNASDFSRLIEAEKRSFDLQIAYENLQDSLKASQSDLNKSKSQFEESKLLHNKQMKVFQEKITWLFQENTRLDLELEASRKKSNPSFCPIISNQHNFSLYSKSKLHHLRNSLDSNQLGLENQYWADQFQKLEYQYLQTGKKLAWLEEENYYLEARLVEAHALQTRSIQPKKYT